MSSDYLHVQHMSRPASSPFGKAQRRRIRELDRLVTYDCCHIGSSIRQRRSSILERSGQASNELCSILWTSSFDFSLDWKRETVNQ